MNTSLDSSINKKKELLEELKLLEKKYETAKEHVTFYNKKADDAQRRVVEAFERNEPYHSFERYASHMRNIADNCIQAKMKIEKEIECIQQKIRDFEEMICFFEMSEQFNNVKELYKSPNINNKNLQIATKKLYNSQVKKLNYEK